jgi:hypothetical protein
VGIVQGVYAILIGGMNASVIADVLRGPAIGVQHLLFQAYAVATALGVVAGLLVARGLWLVPGTSGRAFLAAGFALGVVSGIGVTSFLAANFGVFSLPGWIGLAVAGLIPVFVAAWWSGHEASRWLAIATLVASAASGTVVRAAGSLSRTLPWNSAVNLAYLSGPVLSILLALALLPRHDAPARAEAPDLVLS